MGYKMLRGFAKKKFVRFFGVSLTGTIFVVFFAMLGSILTARLLGPETKGMYTLMVSTITFSLSAVAVKFGLSQVYFLKEHGFTEVASNSIVLSLGSGLLASSIVAVAIHFFYGHIYEGIPPDLFTIVLVAIPLMVFARNMRTMLNADYDVVRSTIVQTSRQAFFCLAFGLVALAGYASLETAIMCTLLSIAGMAILSIFMIYRRGLRSFRLDPSLFGPMISFSLKTHVGQLFKFMQDRFDVFLVAYFLSAKEVGIYSIALALAEILWRIPSVANNILLPRLRGESDRRSAELTARLNRIILVFTLACLAPLVLMVDWVIELLYGLDYIAAGDVVIALLPGVLALSVFKLLTPNLIMRGRVWTYSFAVFCSVTVMILLDMYLIPNYGIVGAGIAASFGYITASLIVLTVVVRINELPLLAYFNVFAEFKLLLSSIRRST